MSVTICSNLNENVIEYCINMQCLCIVQGWREGVVSAPDISGLCVMQVLDAPVICETQYVLVVGYVSGGCTVCLFVLAYQRVYLDNRTDCQITRALTSDQSALDASTCIVTVIIYQLLKLFFLYVMHFLFKIISMHLTFYIKNTVPICLSGQLVRWLDNRMV